MIQSQPRKDFIVDRIATAISDQARNQGKTVEREGDKITILQFPGDCWSGITIDLSEINSAVSR